MVLCMCVSCRWVGADRLFSPTARWDTHQPLALSMYVPVVEAEGEEREEHGRGGGELVACLLASGREHGGLHHQEALWVGRVLV